ncbi:aromatic amino acid transaminase [Actibacterium sp.]|uniref:amino acid aminotransferase n=1 Tax=Actibacterium sp. TaxID=1872125 RepID=UPI003565B9E7
MTRYLSDLPEQAPDFIIQLMAQFRDDPRPDKIDLGVGVYRNAAGETPIMQAVKQAETRLLQAETTKSYVALEGDPAFHQAMAKLILGADAPLHRIAAAGTVGGSGAVNIALQLIRRAHPDARIWVPSPTWANHTAMIGYQRITMLEYAYFNPETRAVDFAALTHSLSDLRPGDVVLLHGCCHNPTGADLTPEDWRELAHLLADRGALPLVDLAYQGFGDGVEADAAPTRLIAETCPEVLIAASCSKNFGLYRERAGVLLALGDAADQTRAQGNLTNLNRMTYSFPPDHGARLVTMILNDPDLRRLWMDELEQMRSGMVTLRGLLTQELRRLTGSDRFGFIAQHRGMFSRLGASPEQVATMRDEFGLYMIGDSRINIAGLTKDAVPAVARTIVAAGL